MGNWKHVVERFMQRVPSKERARINTGCLANLAKKIKMKKMPNSLWYRPVRIGSKVVCYIVGQGIYVSSVLGSEMIPTGIQV